jgi:hypothetical protein
MLGIQVEYYKDNKSLKPLLALDDRDLFPGGSWQHSGLSRLTLESEEDIIFARYII